MWDAWSAKLAVDAGFTALTIGSHPVADSIGKSDNEGMSFIDLLTRVAQVTEAADVPVSADVESGYGEEPRRLIDGLLAAGAVGLNVEDTAHEEGKRLREPEEHAALVGELRKAADAAGVHVVINARTDLLKRGDGDDGDRVHRAIARLNLAADAGADVAYPVARHDDDTLRRLVQGIRLPLNAVAFPDEDDPSRYGPLGVARISFGPALQMALGKQAKALLARWGSDRLNRQANSARRPEPGRASATGLDSASSPHRRSRRPGCLRARATPLPSRPEPFADSPGEQIPLRERVHRRFSCVSLGSVARTNVRRETTPSGGGGACRTGCCDRAACPGSSRSPLRFLHDFFHHPVAAQNIRYVCRFGMFEVLQAIRSRAVLREYTTAGLIVRGSANARWGTRLVGAAQTPTPGTNDMSKVEPIRYCDDLETELPNEDELIDEVIATMRQLMERTFELQRHAVKGTHVKTHGVVTGTLRVSRDLPVELAQGQFSSPGDYEVVIRYASEPGQVDPDTVPPGTRVVLEGARREWREVACRLDESGLPVQYLADDSAG